MYEYLTLYQVKSHLEIKGIIIGSETWMGELSTLLGSYISDCGWTYFYDEDSLFIMYPDTEIVPDNITDLGGLNPDGSSIGG